MDGGFSIDYVNNIYYNETWGGSSTNREIYYCCYMKGIILEINNGYRKYDPYPGGLPTNNIYDMAFQENGRQVIVSSDKGIFLNDYNDSSLWHHYDYTKTPMLDNKGNTRISALGVRPFSDVIYVGNSYAKFLGQLFYYSESKNNSKWIEIPLNNNPKVYRIFVNRSDVWVGTSFGLFQIKNRNVVNKHFWADNLPLKSNNIYDITIDRSRNLWLVTGKGLVRYKAWAEE